MAEQEIPLGANCKLSGQYKVPTMVASRSLGSKDGQTTLVLDFEGVNLSCASSPDDQRKSPDLIRLQLRVNEGDELTPAGKLLSELERFNALQRRRFAVYGEQDPVADLSASPVRDIGEVWSQRDFRTGQRYKILVFEVVRTSLLQEPLS